MKAYKVISAVMSVALLLAIGGVANAQEDGEYSILPVIGTEMLSADGKTWSVEVIDTEYQHGTYILNLEDGSFESVIGDRVVAGDAGLDMTPVEVPAVHDMAGVVAWNLGGGAGGGGGGGGGGGEFPLLPVGGAVGIAELYRPGEAQPEWRVVIGLFMATMRFCKVQTLVTLARIAKAQEDCRRAGGVHSGARRGFCGIGGSPGTCTR